MSTTPSAALEGVTALNPDAYTVRKRDGRWEVNQHHDLPNGHRLKISTYKRDNVKIVTTNIHGERAAHEGKGLVTLASVCRVRQGDGYTTEEHIMGIGGGGDYMKVIATAPATSVTETRVVAAHSSAVKDCFEEVLARVIKQYGSAMGLPGAERPLHDIAIEIEKLWVPKPYFGAVPYLNAMRDLIHVTDAHGCEDGRTQVIYFLSNATTWKGEDAKRIKAELKKLAGIK